MWKDELLHTNLLPFFAFRESKIYPRLRLSKLFIDNQRRKSDKSIQREQKKTLPYVAHKRNSAFQTEATFCRCAVLVDNLKEGILKVCREFINTLCGVSAGRTLRYADGHRSIFIVFWCTKRMMYWIDQVVFGFLFCFQANVDNY